MEIQVKSLLSNEKSPTTLTLPEGATFKQLREALNNHDDLLMVNGIVRQDDDPVSPGDTIVIMPVLAGG